MIPKSKSGPLRASVHTNSCPHADSNLVPGQQREPREDRGLTLATHGPLRSSGHFTLNINDSQQQLELSAHGPSAAVSISSKLWHNSLRHILETVNDLLKAKVRGQGRRPIYAPGRSGSKALAISIALLATRGLGSDRVAYPTAGVAWWLASAATLFH